jgi:hypothetical protein
MVFKEKRFGRVNESSKEISIGDQKSFYNRLITDDFRTFLYLREKVSLGKRFTYEKHCQQNRC